MALTTKNIKKWTKMLFGKSLLHVEQGVGKIYSKEDIKGYYNDLTDKVLKDQEHYNSTQVFQIDLASDGKYYFPTGIIQYGLACYDLYLMKGEELMLDKFRAHSDWACENIDAEGRWDNFSPKFPDAPYCAMAQGEGVSLLLRAYKQFGEEKYLDCATKAVQYMLKDIREGGVCKYDGDNVFFMEYTNSPFVFNGGIFAIWGLYDYLKFCPNQEMQEVYDKAINTLIANIHSFDNGYWSKYDIESKIASPFYHGLHIAQLRVMYDITGRVEFDQLADKFEKYSKKWWNSKKAFVKKAMQKIRE